MQAMTAPHMHDSEAHLVALEEDLEYYRTKRLEPRVLFLARRGIVSLYELVKAARTLSAGAQNVEPDGGAASMEQRIRALEDRLDAYVKEIAATSIRGGGVDVVTEDTRTERGDYDAFFRIAKREHHGDVEERLVQIESGLADGMLLLQVCAQALVQTGLATHEQLQEQRARLSQPGAWNGARIVARAWVDERFKRDLIEHGRTAVRELDIPPGRLGTLGVAENTDAVHNVVVCTLCSCYPYDLLGDTPWWYKHDTYKQRIVREPRATLLEMFDLKVPEGTEIHVHDSTSDVRWMVLPQRPPGTDGMDEAQLAQLVTRECLIGAGLPLLPSGLKAAV